jgi:hypothetical protein
MESVKKRRHYLWLSSGDLTEEIETKIIAAQDKGVQTRYSIMQEK